MLNKKNKTIKVKQLKAYLKENEVGVVKEVYLEVLENFEPDEYVPDLILENLGIDIDDFQADN